MVIISRFVSHKQKEYVSFYFSFLVLSLFILCVVLLAVKHFQSAREFYILKKKRELSFRYTTETRDGEYLAELEF